jgi:hypothetical protein
MDDLLRHARCVPSLSPPAELLLALSRVLADLRVDRYVFGAQAVVHWGRPCLTEDIDVTVELGLVGQPASRKTRDSHYESRMSAAFWWLRRID